MIHTYFAQDQFSFQPDLTQTYSPLNLYRQASKSGLTNLEEHNSYNDSVNK